MIRRLRPVHGHVDMSLVFTELQRLGRLQVVGGLAFLCGLTEGVVLARSLDSRVHAMSGRFSRRKKYG